MRPEGTDDAEYLEYLMEELQVQRDKINSATDIVESDTDLDDADGLDLILNEDVDDEYIESENDLDRSIKEERQHTEAKNVDQAEKNVQEKLLADTENTNTIISGGSQNRPSSTKVCKKRNTIERRMYRPPSPTSYMCYVCGNVYNKKATFAYHMSQHNNIKPHECELCGKSFRQICELKNHMRRHTGEKPYKCSYCDRHFIDRSEKHRHERVHTNTRPYVCSVCGKSFMYSAILKNHSKLHSGKKDFNCMVCQKAFTLQHQLKAHLQTITHKQKEAHYVSVGYEVIYE
ncbi:unnamed protein product [Ceratitis capitata]|nr:unnamed protein product [Ceratitis capitata]